MTRKTRSIPGLTTTFNRNGVPDTGTAGGGSETVDTVSHNLRGLGSYDVGGPFALDRNVTTHSPGFYRGPNSSGPTRCGSLPAALVPGTPSPSSDSALKVAGTQAIANTAPNNPSFSLPTAVGELMHDGIPSVIGVETWRDRANIVRGASSEYLNYEFGWRPLINDITGFAKTVNESHKILREFRKGSGSLTRVGCSFPDTSDVASGIYSGLIASGGATTSISTAATGPGWSRSSQRKWFKGAFTYAVPTTPSEGDRFEYYASEAAKLLGVRLTPDTLWNLAPWSWAVDWFTDTGSYITAVSNLSRDGLVLVYGYMMEHTLREAQWSPSKVTTASQAQYWTQLPDVHQIREHKARIPSRPFLGFTDGTLTVRQQAIAVALGLTHL